MPDIDTAKRSRIMRRSQKLGHCICDPGRQCPCDMLTIKGVCPCAGERPVPAEGSAIKLTELVHNAGCASKIAAGDLETLLSRLPKVNDPSVISGLAAGDDAAIYKINSGTTLVQTVDVFTPCVDDPYAFGKICAANCLSDIYAMGGVPRTALSVLAFPSETHDGEIMYLMMKGAMETLEKAGCALIGGHSIKDNEIKLGFAITGTITDGKAVSLETAVNGDMLVLTKPLGTGVLIFARQIGRPHKSGLKAAELRMMELNKAAAEAMTETGVSACTDITGFGLFGHLIRMMRHSGTAARIYADKLPVFAGALELLREGVIPGAIERNAEFAGKDLIALGNVGEEYKNLGLGSETSGGLLIAVPGKKHKKLIDALDSRGVAHATIGEVIRAGAGSVELAMSNDKGEKMRLKNEPETGRNERDCCSGTAGVNVMQGTAGDSMKAFGGLIGSVTASGKIDQRTKELIIFSLTVLQRCEPCIAAHYDKALAMGISPDELEEAAWCAALIGGAPVKMYYGEYLKRRTGK